MVQPVALNLLASQGLGSAPGANKNAVVFLQALYAAPNASKLHKYLTSTAVVKLIVIALLL